MSEGEAVSPAPALQALAERINRAHERCLGGMRTAVEGAIEAGHLLIEAKAQVAHGGWLPWLEANCPNIGVRMAQRYMRIARSNASPVTHSTITGALEALAAPAPDVVDSLSRVKDSARAILAGGVWPGNTERISSDKALLRDALEHLDDETDIGRLKCIVADSEEIQQLYAEITIRVEREIGRLLLEWPADAPPAGDASRGASV